MDNLEIELRIDSPVIITTPWICSDGLIAYDVAFNDDPDLLNRIPSSHGWDFFNSLEMPIKKEIVNENIFFYHASILRFKNPTLSTETIHQHADLSFLNHIKKPKKRYMAVGGEFKGNKKEFISVITDKAKFWVQGDFDVIDEICSRLTFIGKVGGSGFGNVNSYSIKKIENDYSIIHPKYGLNRPIPIQYNIEKPTEKAIISFKPPYWDHKNHATCHLPENILKMNN